VALISLVKEEEMVTSKGEKKGIHYLKCTPGWPIWKKILTKFIFTAERMEEAHNISC
jgi:hypothetical protein